MHFGLGFPSCREGTAYPANYVRPELLPSLATRAEELGFYSLWANDHLSTPVAMRGYLDEPPNFYEPLLTYASLAHVTRQLRFVLGVIVLPNREPVVLAKQVATLDVLTGGRVILGVGIGSDRDEFQSINPSQISVKRGKLLEERIMALRLLFDEKEATFEGETVRFQSVQLAPKPIQRPFPIYVSAVDANAVRRAGRIADGLVVGAPAPHKIRETLAAVRAAAEDAGRDPRNISLHAQINVCFGDDPAAVEARLMRSPTYIRMVARDPQHSTEAALATFRARHLLGTPEEMVARLREYAAAGLEHLGVIFLNDTFVDLFADMETFARHVIPHFDS